MKGWAQPMSSDSTLPTEPCRRLDFGGITYEYVLVDMGEYTPDGLLAPMGHFARQIGLPAAFRAFLKIKQKRIRYEPVDKILTFFVSLVDGCGYTSDIDTCLKPYRAVAQAWTLQEFAGQNAVNATLHLLNWDHVQQMEQVFQHLFQRNSLALRQPPGEPLVVDIDTKGLTVSPESERFDWATPGYFPGGKGQKGLQFSAAFVGEHVREVLGGCLAPGYAHVTHQMPALLDLTEKRLGKPLRRADLLQQRAQQLQTQAQALREKVTAYQIRISEAHAHIVALRQRAASHRQEIHLVQARLQRLPQRQVALQAKVADHERKVEWCSRQQESDRKRIQKLSSKVVPLERQAALADEEAQGLLTLAQTPVTMGTIRVIILRGDAGVAPGGTVTTVMERGYLFVFKGRDARTARKLAEQITEADWQEVDDHLRAAESKTTRLTDCPYPVRLVVCERTDEEGELSYYFLVTNLPVSAYGTVALVKFYNGRQTIEAFNKVVGNVLWLTHLRTGSIVANYAVAQMAMLAYDFLGWSAHAFFTGTAYEGIAIRELVEKGLRIIARVIWPQPGVCRTELAAASPYARAFVGGAKGVDGQQALPLEFSGAPQRASETE